MSEIIITQLEAKQLKPAKEIPDFRPGDSLRIAVRIKEGNKERIQNFEGVCIRRKGSGLRETITVRRVSYGIGVERVFPLHSPRIESIAVTRRGRVRRAKLHYLRQLSGKKARIREAQTADGVPLAIVEADRARAAAKLEAQAAKAEAAAQAEAAAKAEAAAQAAAEAAAAQEQAEAEAPKTDEQPQA